MSYEEFDVDAILEEIKNRCINEYEESQKNTEPVVEAKAKESIIETNYDDAEINLNFGQADKKSERPTFVREEKTKVVEEPKEEIKIDTVSDFDALFANRVEEIEKGSETEEEIIDETEEDSKGKISPKTVAIIVLVIAIIVAGGFFIKQIYANKGNEVTTKKEETSQTSTPAKAKKAAVVNPLTGESGYSKAALKQRPVAVVVENEYSTESVRPQWGLEEADIVLEGESEYSTRMLLFWADYTKVPKQVGPTRSARPPFIKFSELFDAVFIHAGLSKTKGNYIGADSVFTQDNVDHINLLSLTEEGTYFGRDYSKTHTVEHTGYLNGENVAKLLEKKEIRTTFDRTKFTQLSFNKKAKSLSDTKANKVTFKWTSSTEGGRCPKTGEYAYDAEKNVYTTTDFDSQYGTSGCQWTNLVFLLDQTEYVVKENYKGSGKGETYCNYKLAGGKGMVVSNGTAIDITWKVSNKKLYLYDSKGKEVKLNPGKSYIGYGSSNHGGSFTIEE